MGTGFKEGFQTGIIPQVMNVLFNKIGTLKHQTEFQLHVSFIEILKEEVRDLLDPTSMSKPETANGHAGKMTSPGKPPIQIRETSNGVITLAGSTEVGVTTLKEMVACLEQGSLSRATGSTNMNNRSRYGQALKVNWAYANSNREDTSGHFNVFVGDLSPEVTDATLFACFSVYPSLSDARVMWDHKTGRSKGYGFVSFRDHQDAQIAINDMTGKWLGNRQIRCNWATKGAGASSNEEKNNESQNAVVLTNGSSDGGQDNNNEDAPENNPSYTTVYVGNLPHDVTQAELHCQFHALGAGVIEEVRVQRDKGFGFVRYNTHDEAALAIQMANGRPVRGKTMKCSWGSKPTPPGTASNPLPPPAQPYQILPTAGMNQGYSHAELLAYQRQLALSQAAVSGLSGQALLQMTGQHGLAPASMGINSGASQAMYDGYSGNSSRQQLMYYR